MSTQATITDDIAIVGCGLGGLGLALSLHHHKIGRKITVYEQSASPNLVSPGAIMLSPNALAVLDRLGIYDRIRSQGFNFESAEYRDPSGTNIVGRQWFGSKQIFGYSALRVHRKVIVKALTEAVEERGIRVQFGWKYDGIAREDEDGVEIHFAGGRTVHASLVFGADGIHSRVREHIATGAEPVYMGAVAVVGATNLAKMPSAANEKMEGPIMFPGRAGMFIIAPQNPDGSELMAGTQRLHPPQDRDAWDRFAHDKMALREFLETDLDGWATLAREAILGIDMDTVYIWAQFSVPRIDTWTSKGRRVILVADAAHAIPPTMGQGANQAFEDGFSLALLLSKAPKHVPFAETLAFWQSMRQERVDQLIDLTIKMNNARLPKEQQETLDPDQIWKDESGGKGDASVMEWLFRPTWDKEIEEWVRVKQNA